MNASVDPSKPVASDDDASPRAAVSGFEIRYALSAAAAEGLVVLLSYLTRLPIAAALALHLAIVVALAWSLAQRRETGADLSAPLLTLIATSTAGPVGALIGLLALVWLARPAQPSSLLQAWYDRIALSTTVDDETKLSDRVASGRMLDAAAPPPQALVGVVRSGTLAERQAALGLVARFFHMNYLAALSDALRSDVPVIRVQAAAVASRIRPTLAHEIERRLAAAADLLRQPPPGSGRSYPYADRLQLVREFDQAIGSGLLDKPLEDAAGAMAERLAASVDCLRMPLRRVATLEDLAHLDAFEQRLITSGQFARLRMLRRRRRLAARGFLRIRASAALKPAPGSSGATVTQSMAGPA